MMDNEKCILTISVLASNRKDTFPKTLESLKPILDNIPSELIVVDTGCDDELLSVIRQYTDKIVKFTWCQDFSKARNAGLELAQGKWFMFIDDDEWFEDATDIISFFTSEDKDKYGCARYVVRNYENMEGTSWLDSIAGRIFKLNDGTKFINAVHEEAINVSGPVKNLSSYVHHYGYVFKNEDDKKAHLLRNINLLLEQVKKEPKVARHYAQLTQEYRAAGEYTKAKEIALDGIKNAYNTSDDKRHISGLYSVVVSGLFHEQNISEAMEKAAEYVANPICSKLGKASLYGYCADVSYQLGKCEDSIKYAEQFMELKRYFDSNRDEISTQSTVILVSTMQEDNIRKIGNILEVSKKIVDERKLSVNTCKEKCILSIGILASNRKDTLPKTLESVKPILENVPSELILVDTGCDEELLELIKGYTDKIVKFTWCKDFAKARNVSLEHAQGEWFLYIDDDEWFESVDDFISFFNSEERYLYGSGRYIQRNYRNFEGNSWDDFSAARIFKINKDTKFIDAIHERAINIPGRIKDFDVYAHHYGYVYRNEEERKAKMERNLSLLELQSEKEPHIGRHYAHIAQEYGVAKEYDKIHDVVSKALEKLDMSVYENIADIGGLYAIDVWAYLNQYRYDDVVRKTENYIKSKYCNILCRASLCGFCATSLCELGRYEECIEYTDEYLKACDYLLANPSERHKYEAVVLVYALELDNIYRIAAAGMVAASYTRDIESLECFASKIDFSKEFYMTGHEVFVDNLISIMSIENADNAENKKNVEQFAKIVDCIIKSQAICGILLRKVDELKSINMQGFKKLARIIRGVSSDAGYIQYLRIVCAFLDAKDGEIQALYKKAVDSIPDIVNMPHEFFIIAARCGIELSSLFSQRPLVLWMNGVDQLFKKSNVRELIEKKQDLDSALEHDSIHMKYFDMIFVENLLYRKKMDKIDMPKLQEEIREYYNSVMSFYREIYNDDVFEKYPTILPRRCQVVMKLHSVCEGEMELDEKLRGYLVKMEHRVTGVLERYGKLRGKLNIGNLDD